MKEEKIFWMAKSKLGRGLMLPFLFCLWMTMNLAIASDNELSYKKAWIDGLKEWKSFWREWYETGKVDEE